jgi:TusA-related sulfurtransferase
MTHLDPCGAAPPPAPEAAPEAAAEAAASPCASADADEPAVMTLDATGLACPLPVAKAAAALRRLEPGAHLRVLTTMQGAEIDFRVMCDTNSGELLAHSRDGDHQAFLILRR